MRADLGVMISASHNLYDDNGIKLFAPDGYKLSDDDEAEIERLIDSDLSRRLAKSAALGRAKRIDGVQDRYIEFAKRTLPKNLSLEGMRVVVDCANGAAYSVAPAALWELGAEVFSIGVEPDGFNINRIAARPRRRRLCAKVREMRADIGIALDGDADRVVIVDERGHVVDGDQILAVIAESWKEDGRLAKPGIVATVMSNYGFERFLKSIGLDLVRTPVGDRHVLEADARAAAFNVGGEPSGPHHSFRPHHDRRRLRRRAAGAGGGEEAAASRSRPSAIATIRCRRSPRTCATARQAARTCQGAHRDRGRRAAPQRPRPADRAAVRHRAGDPRHRGRRRPALVEDVVDGIVDALTEVAA